MGEGFLLISGQEKDAQLRGIYEDLYRATLDGGALAPALEKAGVFPSYLLRMTAVAESTGSLERVLRSLAAYYDRQARMRRALTGAVGYPLLLLVIVLAVFVVFLTEVLPVFSRVFDQIGAQMPALARSFLSFGEWLSGSGLWLVVILLALVLACSVVFLVPSLRERAVQRLSRSLARTRTGKKIAEARMSSALSLAVSGASDINEAMGLVCEFTAGSESAPAMEKCRAAVENGMSLSEAAAENGLFGDVYCRMLTIGERSGSTEAMLRDISRRCETDMLAAVDKLAGRVEPAAVVILTLFVGALLLTVMLPLVGIMSAL